MRLSVRNGLRLRALRPAAVFGLVCMLGLGLAGTARAASDSLSVAGSETARTQRSPEPVKIDVLSGYYSQEGDHSAVTGGTGTEELKDFATEIRIYVPLKPGKSLQLDGHISYFTSASSDNIDPATVSSASSNDLRTALDATVTRSVGREERKEVSYTLGFSHEMHFMSANTALKFAHVFPDDRSRLSAGLSYIFDVWGQYYDLSKLYPSDYSGPDDLPTDKRHSLAFTLGYSRPLHARVLLAVEAGMIQQFGLLSTPFHRIIFADSDDVDLERLPGYRIRLPLSVRVNAWAADWLTTRFSYRYYLDNFGLQAHSVQLELPLRAGSMVTLSPVYRFHAQYGHRYFAPSGGHFTTETWYTSDYDQSDLFSHFAGAGLRWSPYFPNRRKRPSRLAFHAIQARGGRYWRSDGFSSWLVSGGLSWSVLRRPDGDQNLPPQ